MLIFCGACVKNVVILCIFCAITGIAMIVGMQSGDAPKPKQKTAAAQDQNIPSIGNIQVLNGCGVPGAANVISDFLRKNQFDVKNIGNAPMSNYLATIVAARTKDMTIAKQVAAALNTDALILMRNNDNQYDATVYVGANYKELVK